MVSKPSLKSFSSTFSSDSSCDQPRIAFDAEAQRGVMPLGPDGNFEASLDKPIALRMDGPEIVDQLVAAGVRYVALDFHPDLVLELGRGRARLP